MVQFDGSGIKIVYTYAPETLISAGDFDALLKAKAEIDAAWAALAEIDQGVFAAPYKHIAPAIKALSKMLREWQAGYAIEARRVDEYRAARNELAEQLKECRSAFDDLYNHDAENRKRIKELEAQLEAQTVPPDAKLYQAVIHELAETKRKLAIAEWSLANEFDKRRKAVDRITHERDEQAAIVADVDKSLAIAHKKIDELKQIIAELGSANLLWYQRWVGMNEENKRLVALEQIANERADGCAGKCDKLEKKVAKLEVRMAKLRAAHFKIEGSFDSATHIRGLAYSAICDDDELAKEQERVCGAS